MRLLDLVRRMLLVLVMIGVGGCPRNSGSAQKSERAEAPVPVQVDVAGKGDVPIRIEAVARVEPYATVTVRPQVAGQIVAVHFDEGQEVSAGDLLFSMDARPYEAAFRQMAGMLAKDMALWEDARLEAERQADLRAQGVAARREYEAARAAAASLEAAVQADQAAVERARLDVEYCAVRAPLAGRTGKLLVDQGNVVKANEASLVVINQINPIYVTFAVPEQHLSEVRQHHSAGTLMVEAAVPMEAGPPERGELTFIDNTVDPRTGMITLRATFQNEKRRLWPGQFVNAVLTLRVQRSAIVVPTRAVQMGQSGTYVYVVKPDQTVEMRSVAIGPTHEGNTVIERGIEAGETVVTDGQLRLVPGASVTAKRAATTTQEASS